MLKSFNQCTLYVGNYNMPKKITIHYRDVNNIRASGCHYRGKIYIDKRLKGTKFEKLVIEHELLHHRDYLKARKIQNKFEKSSLFIQWVVDICLLLYRMMCGFLVDMKANIDMYFLKRKIWNELFKKYPTPNNLVDYFPIVKRANRLCIRPFLFITYLLFILIIVGEVCLLNWIFR